MPEALGPGEIGREQEAAYRHAHESKVVAEPHEWPIRRTAEEVEQRGEEERAACDPADEEIEDDQPGPVRRRGEEGVRHSAPPGRPRAHPSAASAGPRFRAVRALPRPRSRGASRAAGSGWESWGREGGHTLPARPPGDRTN